MLRGVRRGSQRQELPAGAVVAAAVIDRNRGGAGRRRRRRVLEAKAAGDPSRVEELEHRWRREPRRGRDPRASAMRSGIQGAEGGEIR